MKRQRFLAILVSTHVFVQPVCTCRPGVQTPGGCFGTSQILCTDVPAQSGDPGNHDNHLTWEGMFSVVYFNQVHMIHNSCADLGGS